MEVLVQFAHTVGWFLVVLTIVVFFHELGHYSIARLCGVRVDIFSVGFGREILGYTGKSGTRWKVGVVPLGGYVKFFGDAGISSNQDIDLEQKMTAEEKKISFHHKRLTQKIAIVSAGPIANFILAILILTSVFIISGRPHTPPLIGKIVEGSAAAAAALRYTTVYYSTQKYTAVYYSIP